MKSQAPHSRLTPLALLFVIAACGSLHAQEVYINETYESYDVDAAPAGDRVLAVTVTAGSGGIGTDKVANFNDSTTTGGGILEYHAGTAAVGSLYTSFSLLNASPSGTGAGSNPLIFGMGAWDDSSSIKLNSNANRAFGVEFYANGDSSTLKLRVGGSAVVNTTYDMGAVLNVQIWANDHDTNSFSFTRPDTLGEGTLAANSFIVFVNDAQIGASLSGYAMQTGTEGPGDTTGNVTLGRLGFTSGSSHVVNFLIDDLYVTDGSSPIPEPSASAALIGLGALGLTVLRRRRA